MSLWPKSYKSENTQFGDFQQYTGQDIYGHHSAVDFFFKFWTDLNTDYHKPTRDDVRPSSLKQHLDRMCILDVCHKGDELKLTVRLIGTYVAAFYGEISGHDIKSMENAKAAERIYKVCSMAVRQNEPIMSITRGIAEGRAYLDAYALYMPLYDQNDEVDKVLVYADIISQIK